MYRVYAEIEQMMVKVGRTYKNEGVAKRYLANHFPNRRGYVSTDESGHEMPVYVQKMPEVSGILVVMEGLRAA